MKKKSWILIVGYVLACAGALGLVSIFLFACASQSRTEVRPATTTVLSETKEKAPVVTDTTKFIEHPDGTREHVQQKETAGPETEVKQKAEAIGAGVSASGDKVNERLAQGPAVLNIPGGPSATGGGFSFDAKLSTLNSSKTAFWGGIVVLLVGVGAFLLRLRGVGIALGVVGLGMILFPDFIILVLVVGVVGLAAYLLLASKTGADYMAGFTKVVKSIEDTPETVAKEVKARIASHTVDAPQIVKLISKIKDKGRFREIKKP